MTTVSRVAPFLDPPGVAPLHNGDRLTQSEFHKRYEAYPEDVKFELIQGTVYMASPLRRDHARRHVQLTAILEHYESQTPGVELLDNATTILGEESEPQPDLALRILHEYGGQSRQTHDNYVEGPPELILEIAYSTKSIDLHQKREDYQQAGVREYIVLCVEQPRIFWFRFRPAGRIRPDDAGILRSRTFPGLWIDEASLLAWDRNRVLTVLRQGLESPQHVAFVRRLATQRHGPRKEGRKKRRS
jgi:Uma2 family endonuclease